MEYINKKVAMGMIFLVVALFVISFVSGVAFKKIVLIAPGEEITEVIKLQNLNEGDPDLRFIGEITQGSEYVSFVGGNEWVVPNGEMGDAEMKISVPVSASVGDSYMISMTFRSVGEESESGGSAIQFSKSVGITFNVNVVDASEVPERSAEEKRFEFGELGAKFLWGIGIIILLVIVWYVIKMRTQLNNSV